MLFERQEHQEKCVENIINILNEVDLYNNDFSKLSSIIKNHYNDNSYNHFEISRKNRLDILMETGTGKTFTYIKTIFELNKKYNKNKFIIIVPRNAIKLGVIQNIKLTDEFFFGEYGKHLTITEYPKQKIGEDFFAKSKLSVLVLTNSSFNSEKNNINKVDERSSLKSIWNDISALKPIVIIDEPHLLKGDKTTKHIEKLDSLFIRFGATFPEDTEHKISNLAYSLDSISSFNDYLVKKIRVNNLVFGNEGTYKITDIKVKQKNFTIFYNKDGQTVKKTIPLKEDIGVLTGIDELKGITSTKINAKEVFLSNRNTLKIDSSYNLSEDEVRQMIKNTIKAHFKKEEILFKKNIKTLSLFFIPNISNFRGDNPIVKQIFDKEYRIIRDEFYNNSNYIEYKKYLDKDFEDGKLTVREGYFAGDRGANKDEKEAKGIDIILNDKEKLLSLDEPLRFIFSVWALQEGWDNPNIFNICKLSSTDKESSRRQQVGRGLRIAVNQEGKRLTYNYLDNDENKFYDINLLDVFVSSQEIDFIENIQQEINDASFSFIGDFINTEDLKNKGIPINKIHRFFPILEDNEIMEYNEVTDNYRIISPICDFINSSKNLLTFLNDEEIQILGKIFKENKARIENGNKQTKIVKIRQDKFNKFKNLWEKINQKAEIVYKNIEEDKIIEGIKDKFDKTIIEQVKIKTEIKEFNSQTNEIEYKNENTIGGNQFFKDGNLSFFIKSFINDKEFKLPLNFIIKLLNKIEHQKIQNNPKKAEETLKQLIKGHIFNSLLQKIDYNFSSKTLNNQININSLQDDNGKYLKEIKYTKLGRYISKKTAPDNLLYDSIVFDSEIEEDIQAKDPNNIDSNKITVFAKLPKISIPTPYKTYNPDFAYLINKEDGTELFLVVESKGYNNKNDIKEEEKQKIEYAKIFFNKLQNELPNIKIDFQTRINKQKLSNLIKKVI